MIVAQLLKSDSDDVQMCPNPKKINASFIYIITKQEIYLNIFVLITVYMCDCDTPY